MTGFLLHAGATVLCVHAGQAQPTISNPRVKVSGQPITMLSAPYTVAGCPFTVSGASSPCITAQWVTAATRVRAGGVPVLLQDSQAVRAPNGTGVERPRYAGAGKGGLMQLDYSFHFDGLQLSATLGYLVSGFILTGERG